MGGWAQYIGIYKGYILDPVCMYSKVIIEYILGELYKGVHIEPAL